MPSCWVSLERSFQYLQLLYETLTQYLPAIKFKIKNLLKRNIPAPVISAERNFFITYTHVPTYFTGNYQFIYIIEQDFNCHVMGVFLDHTRWSRYVCR